MKMEVKKLVNIIIWESYLLSENLVDFRNLMFSFRGQSSKQMDPENIQKLFEFLALVKFHGRAVVVRAIFGAQCF